MVAKIVNNFVESYKFIIEDNDKKYVFRVIRKHSNAADIKLVLNKNEKERKVPISIFKVLIEYLFDVNTSPSFKSLRIIIPGEEKFIIYKDENNISDKLLELPIYIRINEA